MSMYYKKNKTVAMMGRFSFLGKANFFGNPLRLRTQ
jgi:hypothetical protein